MSDTTPSDASGGSGRVREAADEAGAAARERLDEVRRRAGETAEQARRRAEAEAERGKNRGASEVHNWAGAFERAAGELGRDTAQGRMVHAIAEQVDDVARSIEQQSVSEMVGRVAEFGRRNPLAFAGGAMLAGFALSRFATARPETEDESKEDWQ